MSRGAERDGGRELRRGWTTGACATAAARSAFHRLVAGAFLDPVEIVLPKGERPSFPLAESAAGPGWAEAGVVKDAGDDPDVTHGALIRARVRAAAPGAGVIFRAGEGVGRVTRPGLPIPPGEPAINPAPRAMMEQAIREVAAASGAAPDAEIEISVPGGAALAEKTWNGRLGIVGGLSILGTTGVVRPFSCAAWIASIHRGVDVARAAGLDHVAACTGATSENAARTLRGFPAHAMLDMGDFAGGTLKYLRRHPIARLTLAGGIGKMAKLAQGAMDLHSARSQVDFAALAARGPVAARAEIAAANTALEALGLGGGALAMAVAEGARDAALRALDGAPVAVETLVVDRAGEIVGRADFAGP